MGEWAAAVCLVAWGWMVWRALRWMYLDTIDDIRWYRSTNHCRFCEARLDPEAARSELEMIVAEHSDGSRDE